MFLEYVPMVASVWLNPVIGAWILLNQWGYLAFSTLLTSKELNAINAKTNT